jgi:nitronate monooxygenase
VTEPIIIQGGMGAGVSNWRLARAVSLQGELGVVSGTALDSILARRLQTGDEDGAMRRALAAFPDQAATGRILGRYFIPGGQPPGSAFRNIPFHSISPSRELQELNVIANFAEVFLAKEGHAGIVGINFLEKIQMPTLSCIYGALLAGADYILMGAGIPRAIPGIIDQLVAHDDAKLRLNVNGAGDDSDYYMEFRPSDVVDIGRSPLKRPRFIAIVASVVLAQTLTKKANGHVDGFVIEGPTAGGHNATPRGAMHLNDRGEPIYGPKDEVDLGRIRELGLPFWVAGSYGSPDRLTEARSQGAAGIQVGTLFAYCRESGLAREIKQNVIEEMRNGLATVFTDPLASPTGFPFKVVEVKGTLSTSEQYEARPRICDLGYLRTAYRGEDGVLGYRCPSEPLEQYRKKGGALEATIGRKCLCNGLMANIGFGQQQKNDYAEKPLITSGDDLASVLKFLKNGGLEYSASEVVQYLRGDFRMDEANAK